MDNIMSLLESRRSIRKYQDKEIPTEVIHQLLKAGQMAPSRANSQPWRFIVITDGEIKQKLFDAVYKQKLVLTAPLSICVLGVIDPRKDVPSRTTELVAAECFGQDVKDFADHVLDDWQNPELKVDAALNSSIAATQIMLAAHGLGLGSCWIKLCEDDKVLDVLNVPEGYYNAGILTIGYPDESPKARPRLPLASMSFKDTFGEKLDIL